jgi:hypothetical protein
MLSRFRYILLFGILLFISLRSMSQLAMPDNVCVGAVKHYYVDPNPIPGSTYTWRINGVPQVSSTTNEINITWNTAGTYSLDVQELSVDGCLGSLRAGQVFVKSLPSAPAVSTSAPNNVCPVETISLTALVTSVIPVGGSVLYKTSNNPLGTDVSNPAAVGTGTYYIFYQNQEGCYSSGTLVSVAIITCPPDVTPSLIVNPNIMHGITIFNLTVKVTELNMVNTNGQITVNIPKDSRWILTSGFIQSLTIIGSTPVNNSVWTYSSNATNHIFTTASVIPSGGSLTFGFRVTFNPGSTRGIYTITSQLVSGSGGEIRVSNNADSEKIDYFQQ